MKTCRARANKNKRPDHVPSLRSVAFVSATGTSTLPCPPLPSWSSRRQRRRRNAESDRKGCTWAAALASQLTNSRPGIYPDTIRLLCTFISLISRLHPQSINKADIGVNYCTLIAIRGGTTCHYTWQCIDRQQEQHIRAAPH